MQQAKLTAIFFAAVAMLMVAGLLGLPHLYYMASLLFCLPVASYLAGRFALRGLEFTREAVPPGWEGEETTLCITARNRSPIPRFFLQLEDDPGLWVRPVAEDRPIFNAPPRETARVEYRAMLLKRGAHRLSGVKVTASDPLGLFAFSHRFDAPGEVVVYPTPAPLPTVVLQGADRFGWREAAATGAKGSGVEFDSVRAYVPGDPLRRVHWKVTARTGELAVIERREADMAHIVIALDLFRGTDAGEGLQTTLEYGARLAASLAQQAIQQGATARLLLPGAHGPAAQAGRGVGALHTLLEALARAEANAPKTLAETLSAEGAHIPPGTTLFLLTAHADPNLPPALARFVVTGAQVQVVYIEPGTFDPRRAPRPAERQAFLEGLLAAGARPLRLARNETRALMVEDWK